MARAPRTAYWRWRLAQRCRCLQILVERRLDAQRAAWPVGLDRAIVLGVGHPPIVPPDPAEGRHQLELATALEVRPTGDAQLAHAPGGGRAHAVELLDRQGGEEGCLDPALPFDDTDYDHNEDDDYADDEQENRDENPNQ